MRYKRLEELIQELKERNETLVLGGGRKAIEKQHQSGKRTARERIEMFLDRGSFEEVDLFVEHRAELFGMKEKTVPADGVVTGFGTVDGRAIFVYSQDFTVMGGSLG
ncbi:MAG: methylmalonyl-CoA carboxyltransferase, partial [Atribacterota bacterium]|nr:methylmalonyl-CoA carboxyltransferase [Atribacterota bacterium]